MTTTDDAPLAIKPLCRTCGHNAHSEINGCTSCLPGVDCGPDPDMPEDWNDGRGPGSADAIDMDEFTIGPREALCTTCWLIHPEGKCDR